MPKIQQTQLLISLIMVKIVKDLILKILIDMQ